MPFNGKHRVEALEFRPIHQRIGDCSSGFSRNIPDLFPKRYAGFNVLSSNLDI